MQAYGGNTGLKSKIISQEVSHFIFKLVFHQHMLFHVLVQIHHQLGYIISIATAGSKICAPAYIPSAFLVRCVGVYFFCLILYIYQILICIHFCEGWWMYNVAEHHIYHNSLYTTTNYSSMVIQPSSVGGNADPMEGLLCNHSKCLLHERNGMVRSHYVFCLMSQFMLMTAVVVFEPQLFLQSKFFIAVTL